METYTSRITTTPTEQRILQCVIETIADSSYTQATIGEISQRLGISKGVIQYHFPSKEELMQETIAHIYANAHDYMSSQIWHTANEWEQIRSFIELSCQFYRQHPADIKALQAIRANFQPRMQASLAVTLYERELSDLAKVFALGQQKGIFKEFDPDIMALTLRMALNGVAAKLYSQRDYDANNHANELVKLFRYGLLEKVE